MVRCWLQEEDFEEEEEEEEAEEDAVDRMKTELSENYENDANLVTAAAVSFFCLFRFMCNVWIRSMMFSLLICWRLLGSAPRLSSVVSASLPLSLELTIVFTLFHHHIPSLIFLKPVKGQKPSALAFLLPGSRDIHCHDLTVDLSFATLN